jgi:succinate dehydrogenase / fumarate reductase cytochrome b subunit
MTATQSTTEQGPAPVHPGRPSGNPILRFWRSALGKKWVMAVTGIMLLGFVLFHMLGNLKIYMGAAHLDEYAEWLRTIGEPFVPRGVFLWIMRIGLIVAFAGHIVSAAQLTRMNHRSRPVKYQSPRDYVAADFASRTMRWTGVIVGLFVIFHLMDLTWGTANPDWVRGDVYENVIHSFQRVPVAIVYILANIALAIHIYHGAWSMFQSLGLNNPKWNDARRKFAIAFALVIGIANVSFPLMVVTGVVS